MGGFFGAVSRRDCVLDVFFGTDYHSHLGTRRAGMAAYSKELGFQRDIHNIENSPFRTKFQGITEEMSGDICIGCISNANAQPLLIRSSLGTYAIACTGAINNADQLIDDLLAPGGFHFEALSGGRVNNVELVAALINQKSSFKEGIEYVQKVVVGTTSILIMTDDRLIAARDKLGRLPILVGKDDMGFAVAFESFAFEKLGYERVYELGPGEIISIRADGYKTLVERGEAMKICGFLWGYYGFPTSTYEGVNVEVMRNRNGAILAKADKERGDDLQLDVISGVPDSGVAHAIGYANESDAPLGRPFIKYTPTWPRSFIPSSQKERSRIARMKMIPVHDLIAGKNLLLVDDSIVRGTQLSETVDFLYDNGAKEAHVRSACPPTMYPCKFLNFNRKVDSNELIARRAVFELEGDEGMKHLDEYTDGTTPRGRALREKLCEMLGFTSLEYQSPEGMIEAIGLEPSKICTYCWTGKE